jgi:hypothetical protein
MNYMSQPLPAPLQAAKAGGVVMTGKVRRVALLSVRAVREYIGGMQRFSFSSEARSWAPIIR